jgi:hypothetical protein
MNHRIHLLLCHRQERGISLTTAVRFALLVALGHIGSDDEVATTTKSMRTCALVHSSPTYTYPSQIVPAFPAKQKMSHGEYINRPLKGKVRTI